MVGMPEDMATVGFGDIPPVGMPGMTTMGIADRRAAAYVAEFGTRAAAKGPVAVAKLATRLASTEMATAPAPEVRL